MKSYLRRTVFAAFAGLSLTGLGAGAAMLVAIPVTAQAQGSAQVSDEFQAALDPYGVWQQHPRWGLIWVPDDRPPGWQPYTVGHWVYTDDWGWFWVSDDDEADWGWVTYHYGRWIHDRGAWFWVPGDEWAPAWVNWRRGDTAVGWAPLPPDDVVDEYDDNPEAWVFVAPRYMAAPRLRGFYLPPQRSAFVLRSTVVVNRSFSANRAGARIAVNPGISPGFIGAASRSAIPTFRVRPRVLASTQGVSGAVAVRPQDLRTRGAPRVSNATPAIAVQKTTTLIQPAATVPKAEPLRKDEAGRLGAHPPRAAQGIAPGPVVPRQQQQQQQMAPPPSGSPPPALGPRPNPAPLAAPQGPPPAPVTLPPRPELPPAAATPRPELPPRPEPREEHRDLRPGGNTPAMRPNESPPPPPQAAPRQAAPPPPPPVQRQQAPPPPPPPPVQRQQAPPPPPPVVHAPPPPPPPVVRAPPPPPPPPPPVVRAPPPPPPAVVRPPPPPPPPAAKPPGEKPPEPPK